MTDSICMYLTVGHSETLIRAFNFVPHLSRFAWIGRSPPIQQDVIDALQVHCPNLRSLSTG
jgi:hypothetical protein